MASGNILCIERNLKDIAKYAQSSSRLKFLCIDVSSTLICVGGSTGSIYIFDRLSGELIKFFSHQVQPIKLLKFSHDGKLLAAVASNGHIVCWEIDEKQEHFKIFKEIDSYNGRQVTSICWNNVRHCLYVGDTKGLVSSFAVGFVGFVKSGPDIVRKSGDPIVQLDSFKNFLLISSTSKAMICFTDKGQFHTIGKKPRDGLYGACFVNQHSTDELKIYAARPGSRLWEVDLDGQVKVTHQFKEQLKMPPAKILTCCRNIMLPESNTLWNQAQSINFPYLKSLLSRYILCWSNKSIYVFNPCNGKVLCWNDQMQNIKSISCHENSIYILHDNSSVSELKLNSIKQCLLLMNQNELWVDLAKFACSHEDEILSDVEAYLSIDFYEILNRLQDEHDKLVPDDTVTLFEIFVKKFNSKYTEVRAVVQERLNQVLLNDVVTQNNNSDSGVEDGDDMRSNISDGGASEGGSSSRISLSRLAEINLESVMQKATNALVTKVVNSGFMKKALREALQAEGVIMDAKDVGYQQPGASQNNHRKLQHAHSVPNSPRTKHKELSHTASNERLNANSSNQVRPPVPRKSNSVPSLCYETVNTTLNFTNDVVVMRGRASKKTKAKKKKKMKIINFEEEEKEATSSASTNPSFNVTTDQFNALDKYSEKTFNGNFHEESHNKQVSEFKKEQQVSDLKSTSNQSKTIPEMQFEMTEKAFQIISKLINVTVATRNKFRDPIILYNPKAIHDILIVWSNELETGCKEFQEEFLRNVHPIIVSNLNQTILAYVEVTSRELFFSQLGAAFGEIVDVAMLCVESGIFPENGFELKNHELRLLHNAVSIDELLDTAKKEILKLLEKDKQKEKKQSEGEIINKKSDEIDRCHFIEGFVTPRNSLKTDAAMLNVMEKQSINDLLYDRKSLSTIPSESDIGENVCLFTCEKLDFLKQEVSLCENPNSFYGQCDLCDLDKCRACFVLRYFYVLDFSRIRSLLSWKQGCRWWTWNACIVNLQKKHVFSDLTSSIKDGNLSHISKVLQSTSQIDCLLANATRLNSISWELFDDMLKKGKFSDWEVLMLFQMNICYNAENVSYFLNYATENINKYGGEYLFYHCCLQTALSNHPESSDLFCKCQHPRAGSYSIQWSWSNLLEKLISSSIDCFDVDDGGSKDILQKFKEICQSKGYWKGFIELSCYLDDGDDLLSILLHLQDFQVFIDLLKQGKLKLSEKEWADLLTHINDSLNSKNDGCHCKPLDGFECSMTLDNIVKVGAQYTNARFVLSVMSMFKNNVSFKTELFTSLLKAGELENRQDCLITRLIEVASSQVWSDSKMLIHPQLEQVKQAELQGKEPIGVAPHDLVENEIVMNEADAVWGRSIKISDTDCSICRLPLCLKTLSTTTASLIVFQCGHTFHKICVPENACLRCYHDSFTTLL